MFIALAPADSSCSHAGTLGCGLVKLLSEHLRDDIAGPRPGIALEHDEAPRRQLAVVRHPRADGQDGVEFARSGAGPAHLAGFYRSAVLQEFDGVGH
jgi:hypothetical protein